MKENKNRLLNKKIIKFVIHPKLLIISLMNKNLFFFLPDKLYLQMKYKLITGKTLNLNEPKTFNEKLQWLKLYDRKAEYTTMVDKYSAKNYVAKIIGKEYIIPTLGIYDSFDDIDFEKLPNQFVIKCTHDSGGLIICKNKSEFNLKESKKKINKFLKRKYYYIHREWPYKNVKPRIIIEKYMEDHNSFSMQDYKFFCFNGEPKIMYLSAGLENHETASMSFFDMDFKLTDCKRKDYKAFTTIPPKPKNFEKMKNLARELSKGIPHLRVDFYEIDGKVYFGELTFSTCAGFLPFSDEKWDLKLGNLIDLSLVDVKNKKTK